MTSLVIRDSLAIRLDDILIEATRKPYPSELRREMIRAWIDDLLAEASAIRDGALREKVTIG